MERRLKMISADADLLANLFRPALHDVATSVRDSVPNDAVLVRAGYDAATNLMQFVFSHPSFEPVLPGDKVPEILPMFSIHYSKLDQD